MSGGRVNDVTQKKSVSTRTKKVCEAVSLQPIGVEMLRLTSLTSCQSETTEAKLIVWKRPSSRRSSWRSCARLRIILYVIWILWTQTRGLDGPTFVGLAQHVQIVVNFFRGGWRLHDDKPRLLTLSQIVWRGRRVNRKKYLQNKSTGFLFWNSLKKRWSRVRGVSFNLPRSLQGSWSEGVLEGRQIAANRPLSRANDALQPGPVLGSTVSVPDGDGGAEDGLDAGGVEVHHHCLWQVEFPHQPREEHPLLSLLRDVKLMLWNDITDIGLQRCTAPRGWRSASGSQTTRSRRGETSEFVFK